MVRRLGFTLFDLIILVAGGSISVGVLLPWVAKVRQNAREAQSKNNLKQIALGCHNYHSANGVFPAGVDGHGFSAAAYILPYIEQAAVFETINFSKDMDAADPNAMARKVVIRTFLSPGDPVNSVNADWGATNYLYSAGSRNSLTDNDGVFYRESKISLIAITDGTSNTIMVGETLKGDGGKKAMDVHRQHVQYKKDALEKLNANSGVADFKADKNIAADRCASWMDGRFLQGTFTATRMLNDPEPDVNCGGAGGLSGLRSLSDSVNIALCDGSVRSVNKKVSLQTWQALATRAGGEIIPDY